MMMQDNDRLLTMKEAKGLLGVQTITIQRWDKQGKIRIVRTPGGRRRIPLSEVRRIMEGKEQNGYSRETATESNQKEHAPRDLR